MPDIETLMQEWLPEFEELLGKVWHPSVRQLVQGTALTMIPLEIWISLPL